MDQRLCDDRSQEARALSRHTIRFEASKIAIAVAGLTDSEAERVAARWCGVVEKGDPGDPQIEITVSLNPPDEPDLGQSGHEERFGPWRAALSPGGGRDLVYPVRVTDTSSDAFLKTIDLCMTHALLLDGGVVIHGAASEIGGTGILAVGGSGSGKSTVTAAALSAGARVVSDDLLLVATAPSRYIAAKTLRRELYFREPGVLALPKNLEGSLEGFNDAGEARWRLEPKADTSSFVESLVPERLWLVSVDRRLGESRCQVVDQAAALAWMIRGISSLFLTDVFHLERKMILDVLGAIAVQCEASRVRLGRDLITEPASTIDRLLVESGGS